MENLLVGKDDAGEDQEQWNTRLRPPEHDDSQDEGDGQSEMENGAYHYPLIWDNAADVKSFLGPGCALHASWPAVRVSITMENGNGETRWIDSPGFWQMMV